LGRLQRRRCALRSTAWWLTALVLVALNLRPAIASVPPLADEISTALGLSAAATGLLTTLPVVCMGLFAPVGSLASRWLGAERTLAAGVALIAAGTLLRAVSGAVALYAGTALAGIGIAVAGSLLPPLVRARFPGRAGPVTGLYTCGLIGGAMLAASATVPLASGLHVAWPTALALWAVPAVIALLVWLPVIPAGRTPFASATPTGGVWRSRTAWIATFYMGGQSLLFYTALAWLAPRYTSLGMSTTAAGLLLGLFSVTQLISAFGLPILAHRYGRIELWIALGVGLTIVMSVVIALAPSGAPWVWAGLLGLGVGGNFSLALTLLASLGDSPAAAAAMSGMAFFVGYLLAAAGPVLAGVLYDLTGEYRTPFLALAGAGVATLVVGVAAGRTATR
jgi:CP family cyanate transporter-like MFS transporter